MTEYKRPRLLAKKACLECGEKFTPPIDKQWFTFCNYGCWLKHKRGTRRVESEERPKPAGLAYLEQRAPMLQQETIHAMHRALANVRMDLMDLSNRAHLGDAVASTTLASRVRHIQQDQRRLWLPGLMQPKRKCR